MSDLNDPWWRLNHLYYIKDKQGKKILFKPNWAQKHLYENMWFLNIILKARQIGFTTFIQIFMLDRALFNDNMSGGIVAHNREDAEEFFTDKIKFAYDNLPEDLRNARKATNDTARSLKFSNGSKIVVGTSLRSGTYQYVHISEFGKICAKFPDKAEEVITGTLNTIAPGQIAFIESTAEGPFGEFYDMCNIAQDLTQAVANGDQTFTQMDWKFFFYPWWKHPDYKLHDDVEIPPKFLEYFRKLQREENIVLSRPRRNWYVKKAAEQGDKMKQEYPSTPAEAFERNTELQILGKQLRNARNDKRITRVPVMRGVPVNTFWDLGRNDYTAIWFHQEVDKQQRFVYFMQGRLENLGYYVQMLFELKQEMRWFYGKHYIPHDGKTIDISELRNRTRIEVLEDCGLRPIKPVPRIPVLKDGIDILREKFDTYWFDEEGCKEGLQMLTGYEWVFDSVHGVTRNEPARGASRHAADALRMHAEGYRGDSYGWSEQMKQAGQKRGGGRQYAKQRALEGTSLNPTYEHLL